MKRFLKNSWKWWNGLRSWTQQRMIGGMIVAGLIIGLGILDAQVNAKKALAEKDAFIKINAHRFANAYANIFDELGVLDQDSDIDHSLALYLEGYDKFTDALADADALALADALAYAYAYADAYADTYAYADAYADADVIYNKATTVNKLNASLELLTKGLLGVATILFFLLLTIGTGRLFHYLETSNTSLAFPKITAAQIKKAQFNLFKSLLPKEKRDEILGDLKEMAYYLKAEGKSPWMIKAILLYQKSVILLHFFFKRIKSIFSTQTKINKD